MAGYIHKEKVRVRFLKRHRAFYAREGDERLVKVAAIEQMKLLKDGFIEFVGVDLKEEKETPEEIKD